MTDSATRVIVDRLEGEKGMLESLGAIPRQLLPSTTREGDVLRIEQSEDTLTISIDREARSSREEALRAARDGLEQAPGPNEGEFEL